MILSLLQSGRLINKTTKKSMTSRRSHTFCIARTSFHARQARLCCVGALLLLFLCKRHEPLTVFVCAGCKLFERVRESFLAV